MALGTAGFTAALAIHRMEQNGQSPQGGPIVVTGASGGVGSVAIDMLARARLPRRRGQRQGRRRRRTCGSSARTRCCARQEIDLGSRPLETARFGGAIDNLGGEILTWLTRTRGLLGQHRQHRAGGRAPSSRPR